jgi:Protein of unknown function (DUF5133)
MLVPHPVTLRGLLRQYTAARERFELDDTDRARQGVNDAAYTLCVTTGTRDIDTALVTARRQLSGTPQRPGGRPESPAAR